MHYELRTSSFEGDIGLLVKKYSNDFIFNFSGNRSDIEKYSLMVKVNNDPYSILVSSSDNPLDKRYKVILSVIGEKKNIALAIMDHLVSKLKISAEPAPKKIKKSFEEFVMSNFKSFS